MTYVSRLLVTFVILASAVSACAPKTAPTVPTSPKYGSFIFPAVPQDLETQPALATRHNQAWQRLQAGDLRGAERDFRWVTTRSGAYYPSETGLGYVALARNEFKQALEHFELALAVAPRYSSALVGRGDALLGLGRTADAVANYEDALSVDSSLAGLRGRIDALRFKAVEDEVGVARKARDAGHLEEAVTAYQRAIASSPESGFLYRELASVEQRSGNSAQALEHARKAAAIDPSDARAHLLAGEILEAQHDYKQAVAEYEAASAIEPSPETAARIEAARERADLAALPPEFHAIASDPAITREALAALIGVNLEDLLQRAQGHVAPVMTDTRESWASRWITSVVRAGIMDPFPNHTFQPAALVRRSDLAEALSRLLPLAAAGKPQLLAEWREGRPRLSDVSPSHLVYPAAAMTVQAGVLPLADGDAFEPGRAVSGAEATEAIGRVETIWRGKR
ncbi:MAG: tetratricopeptide repeat protein [Acidobacteriota bacterium]